MPTTPVSGLGKRAYVFYPTPRNSYQGNVAFLVVESGDYTLALSLDAPEESRPNQCGRRSNR